MIYELYDEYRPWVWTALFIIGLIFLWDELAYNRLKRLIPGHQYSRIKGKGPIPLTLWGGHEHLKELEHHWEKPDLWRPGGIYHATW